MKVLLTSHGSAGDIFPLIALGVALKTSGHQVTFAAGPLYRNAIEGSGLRFAALPAEPNQDEAAAWMARVQNRRTPFAQLREIYRASLPRLPETARRLESLLPANDLLVFSYLFPWHGSLARSLGVPAAAFAFAHNSVPSSERPPDGFSVPQWIPASVRRVICRGLWRMADRAIDFSINRILRQASGMGTTIGVRRFFAHPADLILVAVSPALMRPSTPVPERFRFTGYCRWQPSSNPTMETELAAFTGGQPVPVLTFGSMVEPDPAGTMHELARNWPSNHKLIVQSGWAGFPPIEIAPHIRVIGEMPHDRLFRHASIIIHHGGAGVTASALHAGKPQLVVPHIADQNFFGREVERLGAGRRLARRGWPQSLAAAAEAILADTGYSEKADNLRQIVLRENGPANAVRELEAFVG